MSRDMMYVFQRALRPWLPYIQRRTYATSVEVVLRERGEFAVRVAWNATRVSPSGEHEVVFTRQRVLGTGKSPLKKVCRYRDDAIREVLQARSLR